MTHHPASPEGSAPGRVVDVDLVVVGAGPTGLFATYYAGFRGHRIAVVDSLPEHGPDGIELGLDDGTVVRAGAMIITAGIGKFSPRPLPAGEDWLGRGLEFFVPSFEPYVGRDVVIVGGGDSAFDWAVHLEPVARSVTLVHRRDAFRAHERTVEQVRASSVRLVTRAEVTALRASADDPAGPLAEVDVTDPDGVTTLPCQAVVAALGFVADLGPIQQWGVEVLKRHVVVDSSMRTSLGRVFAAGDITEYPGKVRLIAVGFGEAATAVNNATVAIDPTAKVFPGHSSEGG